MSGECYDFRVCLDFSSYLEPISSLWGVLVREF